MNKIGLLAGVGKLPVEFARAARGMGFHVVGIAVLPEVDAELKQEVAVYHQSHIAKLGTIFDILRNGQNNRILAFYIWLHKPVTHFAVFSF